MRQMRQHVRQMLTLFGGEEQRKYVGEVDRILVEQLTG